MAAPRLLLAAATVCLLLSGEGRGPSARGRGARAAARAPTATAAGRRRARRVSAPTPPAAPLLTPAAAAAARPLRPARALSQYTGTMTGSGVDKSNMAFATTDYAEARAQAKTYGIAHNEATQVAAATQTLPSGQIRAATTVMAEKDHSITTGAAELSTAAMGPVAVANTDTGATALASSRAMQLAEPDGPGVAKSSWLASFYPVTPTGTGNQKNVMANAVTLGNIKPANSFGISDIGDGPHAMAVANQAAANSFAAKQAF
jgi:hypothetical protein